MKRRILVIDDDEAILEVMKIMLELEGYEAITVSNASAIKQIKKTQPDLVLLDIWLSGQDGRKIARYLKKDPSTAQIPILMVSASKDMEQSAREAGADDFIPKPFEMDYLLERISSRLSYV